MRQTELMEIREICYNDTGVSVSDSSVNITAELATCATYLPCQPCPFCIAPAFRAVVSVATLGHSLFDPELLQTTTTTTSTSGTNHPL